MIGAAVLRGLRQDGFTVDWVRDGRAAETTLASERFDLVLLVPPRHPFARRRLVHMDEVGRQPVVAHNESSPARDRVLRMFERRQAPLNIRVSLPSLDAVKRAVELGLGVHAEPHRVALGGGHRRVRRDRRRPDRQRRLRFVTRSPTDAGGHSS